MLTMWVEDVSGSRMSVLLCDNGEAEGGRGWGWGGRRKCISEWGSRREKSGEYKITKTRGGGGWGG